MPDLAPPALIRRCLIRHRLPGRLRCRPRRRRWRWRCFSLLRWPWRGGTWRGGTWRGGTCPGRSDAASWPCWPGGIPVAAHRQDCRQVGRRRSSRRGRRADLRGHRVGQLAAEDVARCRCQLSVAAQIASRRVGKLVREPGELQRLRPARQWRRHHREDRRQRRAVGHALLQHVGTGEDVADALALHRHDRRNERDWRQHDRVDLDEADQGSDQSLAEPLRASVVADHAQPERHLAERLAPGQRLEDGRIADDDEHVAAEPHCRQVVAVGLAQ